MAWGKKKAIARKPYARKRAATTRIARAPRTSWDGTTILCQTYFELTLKQAASDTNPVGKMAYSIKCDPRTCTLLLPQVAVALNAAQGLSVDKGDGTALMEAASGNLAFSRYATFAPLYGQYKINSVKINVDVDRECGLDNPVCFSCDKAIAAPSANMSEVMASAHKQHTMTESRRTAKYGFTPKGQDKDWRNTNQDLHNNDSNYLKVYQEVEPKNQGICKHRVTVLMSVTLKDSQKTHDLN